MRPLLFSVTLLVGIHWPSGPAARADEPARIAFEPSAPALPPGGRTVVVHEGPVLHEHVVVGSPSPRFHRRGGVNVLERGPNPPRAFVFEGRRYEPKLRDIRLLPRSRTLPEGNFGARETLPVLPHREAGYFVLPHD